MYKNSSSSLVHIRVGEGLEGRNSFGVTDSPSDTVPWVRRRRACWKPLPG